MSMEVKAQTKELTQKPLEWNRKYPNVFQENQRDPGFTLTSALEESKKHISRHWELRINVNSGF